MCPVEPTADLLIRIKDLEAGSLKSMNLARECVDKGDFPGYNHHLQSGMICRSHVELLHLRIMVIGLVQALGPQIPYRLVTCRGQAIDNTGRCPECGFLVEQSNGKCLRLRREPVGPHG